MLPIIQQMRAEGATLRAIATHLNLRGVTAPRGKWSAQQGC
jgi:hypothetical protein